MAQATTKDWLDGIQKGLLKQLTENRGALPKGFNQDRFILNSITVIRDMLRDNKKKKQLQEIDYTSIPICLAKGAFLGLDFFNGECYAIPYGGEMKFQTDYKGEIKLCKRYSKNEIKDIFAKVVREGDFFEESVDSGVQNVVYKPLPFSNKPLVGAFAIVVFKDGSMLYDTMGKEEIENVRNTYSKAANSQAWVSSTGEMYKKTVLRRLCKLIDLDFDNIEQMRAYEDGGDAEFRNTALPGNTPAALPDNGTPVDVFAQVRDAQEKEPVPAGNIPESNLEDFRKFEEQQYGQPPVGEDFMIPDDIEDELPFG